MAIWYNNIQEFTKKKGGGNLKIVKNRYLLVLISLIVSVLIAFVIIPLMAGMSSGTVDVVRVREVIKPNTLISMDMLKIEKAGKINLPNGIIKDPDEVVGKYSKVELLPGDNLVPDKFISTEALEDSYLYDLVKHNKVAVSISIKSFAAGVSGKIRPGDIISILYFDKSKNTYPYASESEDSVVLHPQLQNIEVAAVSKAKEGSDYPDSLTVLVTIEQAKLLVEAENDGNIHILAAGRGGESKKLLLKEDS
jgi:pilus assembly protein CpaB